MSPPDIGIFHTDTSKRTGGHGRETNTGKGMVEENGMETSGSLIRAKVEVGLIFSIDMRYAISVSYDLR
jgi:hypothetical protein